MNLQQFLKTFDGTVLENKWLRMVLMVTAVTTLIAVFGLLGKEQRVVLQPVTLTSDAWVEKEEASETYKTAWGAFLATLMGNITPSSLDFIKERLEVLLAPSIYNETLEAFERQAQDIRENRISMRFELRSVDYEPSTGKIFAYGYRYASAAGSTEAKRTERTYEYRMRIRDYMPEVTNISTYEGRPKTEHVLRLEKDREQDRS